MFDLDLSQPLMFLIMVIFMFIAIVFRYFLIAGFFYFLFHLKNRKKCRQKKINKRQYLKAQFRKEIQWSLTTAFIFSIIGAVMALLWQKGYTAFYEDINQYGFIYLIASVFIMMLIHETYYYWIHRLMHQPKIYKAIHKIHHESITTSPWTSFSFHPLEGFLEALILPLIVFFLPIHHYTLLFYLIVMTLSSVINHLNIEIYPSGFKKNWVGKWFIGATHHSLHHSQFKYNYGLYFTFWDKLSKTESPDYKNI